MRLIDGGPVCVGDRQQPARIGPLPELDGPICDAVFGDNESCKILIAGIEFLGYFNGYDLISSALRPSSQSRVTTLMVEPWHLSSLFLGLHPASTLVWGRPQSAHGLLAGYSAEALHG